MSYRLLEVKSAVLLVSALSAFACSSTSSGDGSPSGKSVSGAGNASAGKGPNSSGAPGSGGGAGVGGAVMTSGGVSSGGAPVAGASGAPIIVSGTKTLASLTAAESTQLCRDTSAYYGKNIPQATLCKATGLVYAVSSSAPTDALRQQNCTNQEHTCLQGGPPVANCTSVAADCPATVAEFNTCIADMTAAYNQKVTAMATCATLTLADLAAVWDFTTGDPPASCASVIGKCPSLDIPSVIQGTGSPVGTGGSGNGGNSGGGGAGASGGPGAGSGGAGAGVSGASLGGAAGTAGKAGAAGASAGVAGKAGAGGAAGTGTLPGDIAKAAGTPFVAAHAMTRALFAAYKGPLFKALRVSDNQEKDISTVASTGFVDLATLNTFCSGTTCKVSTLYDQSGNGNDMWRADDPAVNQPGTVKPCDLMSIDYWTLSDGTKVPVVVETGDMWKAKSQCLRNRDKTKNMPTGAKPQTTYAIFHQKYLNNNCCFNYGNTGNAVHYTGPGTLSALNFSKITFWSKGTGNGPWVMVDWEQGVYAGNTAKCGSGAAPTADCTTTGENVNPSVTFDLVTTLFKHNGVSHWALKNGNAKSGALAVSLDLPSLPKGYSPLKQEGGLGLGEGGAGDSGGDGGFSEGGVMAAETTDATDNAIQSSIVSVYGK